MWNKMKLLLVFFVLAKAFISISQEIFLEKIENNGFGTGSETMPKLFLSNRKKCVKMETISQTGQQLTTKSLKEQSSGA